MHIRKFRAATISQALEKVKEEFGEDAVIMHTGHKLTKNPATGKRKRIAEVVAAMDFDAPSEKNMKGGSVSPVIKKKRLKAHPSPAAFFNTPYSSSVGKDESILSPANGDNSRDEEITELKKMLRQAIDALNEKGKTKEAGTKKKSLPMDDITAVFTQLEIPGVMHNPLASRMLRHLPHSGIDRKTALSWIKEYAARNIKTVTDRRTPGKPCWQAFIGPTGVGKTTTLAKLAAIRKYIHGEKGLMISVDTYRLGAFEQLRRYGELTDIPVKTASSHGELLKIFAANSDKDFIFVDTTGRSPVMSEHINELRRLFDALPGLDAKALLCANHKAEDMKDLITLYKKLPVTGWIISKTDETRHYAPLFLPLLGYQIPVSHITNGQRVPEDIKEADRKELVKMLFANNITNINTPFRHDRNKAEPVTAGRPVHMAYMENV